ncbi:hypothetical protein M0R45_008212 [Rubus argutus]|uniref:Pentatricopeptide repeat-containing protein n=1 Tax=Rubus argutus TaxID=59490 RepID=A0AAW1Y309_RUBAR
MMRRTTSSSYSCCCSNSRRGMPFLHTTSTTTLVVSDNNYFALFHSKSSNTSKGANTQLRKLVRDPTSKPKVTNVDDALKVFDEMLHRRPVPSVVRFNQLLGQLAKLKHYSLVINLFKQMGQFRIAHDNYTLNIIINCYCHLNQMGFSLSVLGQFFKLGLQPDVTTYNTVINSFVLKNKVAEAARLFCKMLEGGHCDPNVVTFGTLIRDFA